MHLSITLSSHELDDCHLDPQTHIYVTATFLIICSLMCNIQEQLGTYIAVRYMCVYGSRWQSSSSWLDKVILRCICACQVRGWFVDLDDSDWIRVQHPGAVGYICCSYISTNIMWLWTHIFHVWMNTHIAVGYICWSYISTFVMYVWIHVYVYVM